METVYVETSVVSYLVARPPADTIAHQWHVWTEDWWRLRRPIFECVVSAEVFREAAAGDAEMSRLRMEVLRTLTVLRRTPAVDEVVDAFLAPGLLPAKAEADAVHLAFATVYEVNFLLTWNLRHLSNAMLLLRLKTVAERRGWRLPLVCTPVQLMGTIEYGG